MNNLSKFISDIGKPTEISNNIHFLQTEIKTNITVKKLKGKNIEMKKQYITGYAYAYNRYAAIRKKANADDLLLRSFELDKKAIEKYHILFKSEIIKTIPIKYELLKKSISKHNNFIEISKDVYIVTNTNFQNVLSIYENEVLYGIGETEQKNAIIEFCILENNLIYTQINEYEVLFGAGKIEQKTRVNKLIKGVK